jgi:autotransporter adhesin
LWPASKSGLSLKGSPNCLRRGLLAGCAFAIGVTMLTSAPAFAGCNSGDTPDSTLLSQSGCQARALGAFTTAIGSGATAAGDNGFALGRLAGSADLVVGAMNIGNSSSSFLSGNWSMAIGNGTNGGDNAAYAKGAYAIAIGQGNGATFEPVGADIVAKLKGAKAMGFLSMAIGTAANATAGGSTAIGHGSNAIANDALALGEFSDARAEGTVAVGLFSEASGKYSVAAGRSARATKPGSVAIGNGSVANLPNVVSVGTAGAKRRIVNVANGVSPSDAVTMAQLQAALSAATVTVRRLEARIAQLEGGIR